MITDKTVAPLIIDLAQSQQVTISYRISQTALATVRVFNEAGEMAKTFYIGKTVSASDTVTWDGIWDSGVKANGIYTYKIEAKSLIGGFPAEPVTGTIEVAGA